jgi:hypothetical protein
MLKPPHDVIDDICGIFVAFLSQMQIHHGGFQLGMAQIFPDDPKIYTRF